MKNFLIQCLSSSGKVSSTRLITLMSFILLAICFISNLFWDKNIDLNTNIVDVYVNYLRNKVDKGFDNKLIHTIIGMGYVLKEE